MKKILVPTDFSEHARAAEELGLELAKKAGAEIHFLHVVITPLDWIKLPLERAKLYPETVAEVENAEEELSKLVEKAEAMGLIAKHFVNFNNSREEINEHALEHVNDFIVIGAKGTSRYEDVMGSNTQRLIRDSKIPLFVVRKNTKMEDLKNLVLAISLEKQALLPLEDILDFAKTIEARIHLLYINTPFQFKETDEIEESMEPFLEQCPPGTTANIYDSLNEERGIGKFAEANNTDLLALTTHGKGGLMRLISPSVTEALINHSEFPILSVNIHS